MSNVNNPQSADVFEKSEEAYSAENEAQQKADYARSMLKKHGMGIIPPAFIKKIKERNNGY